MGVWHGLPKVSPGPAMPDPATPCKRATPETALRPFQGWPIHKAVNLRPSSTLLDSLRKTNFQCVNASFRIGDWIWDCKELPLVITLFLAYYMRLGP
jgi:hypothetical protein